MSRPISSAYINSATKPRTVVEVVPRDVFLRNFGEDYQPGQHVSLFGPTGRGKSTLCFQMLGRVISPDLPVTSLHGKIKGRDPVLAKAAKRYHLRLVPELPSATRQTYDRRRGWNGYIIVPLDRPETAEVERKKLRAAFGDAIHAGYSTTKRKSIVHICEAHQIQKELRLIEECEQILMRGAPDVAEWSEAQRGRYLSYHTYSAPEHLFVFYDDDLDNRRRYSDFGCADPDMVMWLTSNLKTFRVADGRTISQCLYIRRGGGMYVIDV